VSARSQQIIVRVVTQCRKTDCRRIASVFVAIGVARDDAPDQSADLSGVVSTRREAYSLDGACTNQAEEYFSRLRQAEIGIHHHIAGAYLLRYAQESSWREDNRRVSNGDQVNRVAALAMKRGKSVDLTGYWQRHVETA
jgi:hypothetical protein